MADNSPSFLDQDSFTEQLLKVFYDLTERGAYKFKKDFTNTILTSLNFFHLIERNKRNYPADSEKRRLAKGALLMEFGVNPDYIDKKSEQMYLSEPKAKKKKVFTKEEISVSNYGRKQKQKLQEELELYKKKAESLEAELSTLRKRLENYEESDKKHGQKTGQN